MIVYKLTCSSGRVYFGSSIQTLEERKRNRWHTCACKDFDIVKMEVIEEVEDKNKLLDRESYYIENFPCVNRKTARATEERKLKQKNDYRHKTQASQKYYCKLCDKSFYTPYKLNLHIEGSVHKLKEKCKEELGENWNEGTTYHRWVKRRNYHKNKQKKISLKCNDTLQLDS